MMLALIRFRELSRLDELLERVRLLVWFVVMLAFTAFRAVSTLEEKCNFVKLHISDF